MTQQEFEAQIAVFEDVLEKLNKTDSSYFELEETKEFQSETQQNLTIVISDLEELTNALKRIKEKRNTLKN